MIKNFLFLTLRNYLKNKAFVIINVIGLGIAMACCIVAYLNYRFDADFNLTHENRDNIYKINSSSRISEELINSCVTPISLGPAIEKEIAGIDQVVRLTIDNQSLKYQASNDESKIFEERICFADKGILDMFTFPLKYGDKSAFQDPNNIMLSLETSKKFFGEKNPVGEALTLFNKKGEGTIFTVGGVFEEIPHNSIVRFSALSSLSKYIVANNIDEFNWKRTTSGTFLQVANPQLIDGIEKQLARYKEIQNKNREDWQVERFYIESLEQYTKGSGDLWDNRIGSNLHPGVIYSPAIMAILLTLLTCFNFINTAIASSSRRLKEIGVRKVIGGSRRSLILQFIGENFLICFIALILALILGIYLTGEFNKLMPVILTVNYFSDVAIWFFFGIVLVLITLSSAFYPALYVSSFNPIQVIRGTVKFSGNGIVSKILLVFQFGISLIALISGLIMMQNGTFQSNFDHGYNRNGTVIVPGGNYSNINQLQNELKGNPEVLQMTIVNRHPEFGGYRETVHYQDKKVGAETFMANVNFCSALDLDIVEGRGFSAEFESSDMNKSVLVNECFVRELKLDNPVGSSIKIDDQNFIIVGVTEDFYEDILYPLLPAVIQMQSKEELGTLIIKSSSKDLFAFNQKIKKAWEKVVPNAVYPGNVSGQFKPASSVINVSLQKMYGFLSVVSVFLSVIALYTLISQTIISRTKEIGIRKVVGSTSLHINVIIGKSYFYILLMAAIVGGASGYYLNLMFLDVIFKFHTPITMQSIIIPVLFIFVLSLLTLVTKVSITLSKNPIQSLTYE